MEQRHVLVVEDDVDTLGVIVAMLKAAGYRVTTATDGNAALRAARADRPDLAIIDLLLPRMDGYELCAMFGRDRTLGFPMMVISGRSTKRDAQRALDAGAGIFLAKPFSDQQLLGTVERLLTGKTDGP